MSQKTPENKQSPQTAIKIPEQDCTEETRSPHDEYKNDVLVSLKELRAGEVIDAADSMRQIRRELGIDAD